MRRSITGAVCAVALLAGCAGQVAGTASPTIGRSGTTASPTSSQAAAARTEPVAGRCTSPQGLRAPETSASAAELAADVAATERIAMSEPVFWQFIADLGGRVDEAGFKRLVQALESCDLDGLIAWHARLTLVLFALDGEKFHQWYVDNDPDQMGSVSADVFLYARCDAVAAGEQNWRTALRDGSLPWLRVVPGTGEYLLYAAAEAAGSVGIGVDAFYSLALERIPISFETGSNTDQW